MVPSFLEKKMSWIKKGLELCEKATPGPWRTVGNTLYPYETPTPNFPFVGDVPTVLFIADARTNYPRALKLLAEFKPLAEGLIPIAEDVLKLPKLNTEGARLGLEHLKQLLSELESEV